MDETALALNRSVMRWHRFANVTDLSDPAIDDQCPLCLLFLKGGCAGCPIADMTGQTGCRGTNYRAAIDAYQEAGAARLLFPDHAEAALENFRHQAQIYAGQIEAARDAWFSGKGRMRPMVTSIPVSR